MDTEKDKPEEHYHIHSVWADVNIVHDSVNQELSSSISQFRRYISWKYIVGKQQIVGAAQRSLGKFVRGKQRLMIALKTKMRSKWGAHQGSEEQMRSTWVLGGANEKLMSARRSKCGAHEYSEELMSAWSSKAGAHEELMRARRRKWGAHEGSEEQTKSNDELRMAQRALNNVAAAAAKPPRRVISVLGKILCALCDCFTWQGVLAFERLKWSEVHSKFHPKSPQHAHTHNTTALLKSKWCFKLLAASYIPHEQREFKFFNSATFQTFSWSHGRTLNHSWLAKKLVYRSVQHRYLHQMKTIKARRPTMNENIYPVEVHRLLLWSKAKWIEMTNWGFQLNWNSCTYMKMTQCSDIYTDAHKVNSCDFSNWTISFQLLEKHWQECAASCINSQ